jgi:hypothetical protein
MEPLHRSGEGAFCVVPTQKEANVNVIEERIVGVDAEFRALIPPPSAGERAALESSLIAEGCRDALVVWNGILLDGHTRLAICKKHQIEYRTVEIELSGRSAAKEWLVRNQLGRRNLTPFGRAELVRRLEPMIAARAKENQRGQKKSDNPINTKDEMARLAQMSSDTWHKAKVLIKRASDELKLMLRSGEISINAAYQQIATRPKSKRQKLEERTRLVSEYDGKVIRMPDGRVGHLKGAVLVQWENVAGWSEVHPEELLQAGGKYEEAAERGKKCAGCGAINRTDEWFCQCGG